MVAVSPINTRKSRDSKSIQVDPVVSDADFQTFHKIENNIRATSSVSTLELHFSNFNVLIFYVINFFWCRLYIICNIYIYVYLYKTTQIFLINKIVYILFLAYNLYIYIHIYIYMLYIYTYIYIYIYITKCTKSHQFNETD